MSRRFSWMLVLFAMTLLPFTAIASEWTHWRGPAQTGVATDTGLPDKVGGNVIWRVPFGCRSTPLVFNDRVYFINYDADKVKDGKKEEDVAETIVERVMCLDAKTGKTLWQHTFPIFHTDIVTSRLGWTNVAADPATGYIYAHGTQGLFLCLDGKDGKLIWQRSMGEEFGRVSGYGGRITSPIVDEEFAILGMVNSSWGDQAKGGNRFVALNKRTGSVVWWSTPAESKGTYYSNPVIATINNQRLLISGGADGSVFAIKVRTGEPVWHYVFSQASINSTPVVDGNFVYIGHGEENPDNNIQGRVICLDASEVKGGQPKLVWQVDGIKARYASPIILEGRLYIPDDGAKLFCLDAKTGDQFWKYSYGRSSRGSPVWADGKIYVGDVGSRFVILEPGDKRCKKLDEEFFPSPDGVTDVELNGSPAVANGRVFFSTSEETICIGTKDGKAGPMPKGPAATKVSGKVASLIVVPGEVTLHPGESTSLHARAYDADGNFIKNVAATWSLPAPTPPPGAKTAPPALKGEIDANGKLTVDAKMTNQQSIAVATFEGISARARIRVAPRIPYSIDFDKLPEGIVPGGWVNTQGKWLVKTINGNKVLAKVNDKASPLLARGNAYITVPTASDYTIEADVQGLMAGSDMPDVGIVANRYTLMLAGNVQKLRIVAWDPLPRIDKTIQYEWKPGVWYRMKMTTEIAGGKGTIRGKVWPADAKEPANWTIEVTDSRPMDHGSAALYAYVTGVQDKRPGTEVYFDNVKITPNKAAKTGALEQLNQPALTRELMPEGEIFARRPLFPLLTRFRQ
jgi:outer membrane protein assembly factor BamB